MPREASEHVSELPFGHPGRNFDETPVYFDDRPLNHWAEPNYGPDEWDDDAVSIHYGPGDRPLCGAESWTALHSDDPAQVRGCPDCLELVEEDLGDKNHYAGRCLHCRQAIEAQGGVAWRRAVRQPCPHCGKAGW